MQIRISICNRLRKSVYERLRQAYATGNLRLIRRIHALLQIAGGQPLTNVAEMLNLGEQTVRDYIHAFILKGYAIFLTEVLARTRQHLILIQDGAPYHTSKAMSQSFAGHADRLTVFQLPSYSPDFNPIEFLWKKVKKRATHLKFFPEFAWLMQKVEDALLHFANTPKEIMSLMGRYCESLGAIAA